MPLKKPVGSIDSPTAIHRMHFKNDNISSHLLSSWRRAAFSMSFRPNPCIGERSFFDGVSVAASLFNVDVRMRPRLGTAPGKSGLRKIASSSSWSSSSPSQSKVNVGLSRCGSASDRNVVFRAHLLITVEPKEFLFDCNCDGNVVLR